MQNQSKVSKNSVLLVFGSNIIRDLYYEQMQYWYGSIFVKIDIIYRKSANMANFKYWTSWRTLENKQRWSNSCIIGLRCHSLLANPSEPFIVRSCRKSNNPCLADEAWTLFAHTSTMTTVYMSFSQRDLPSNSHGGHLEITLHKSKEWQEFNVTYEVMSIIKWCN